MKPLIHQEVFCISPETAGTSNSTLLPNDQISELDKRLEIYVN